MRIFLTHCCAKKDDTLQNSSVKVTPDKLYRAMPTKRFMEQCKWRKVNWAIFSDKYGVWFPEETHEWYEKDPDTVTPTEYKRLIENFEQRLDKYDEIWFYHNPGRFHPLYERLLKDVRVKGKITLFTHKNEIARGSANV